METEKVWIVFEGSYKDLDTGIVRGVYKTLEGARQHLLRRVSEKHGPVWTKLSEDKFRYGNFYLMIEAYDLED